MCSMIIIKAIDYLMYSFHYTAGGDLSKIHMPKDDELNEMVRRMEKFDEAPKKGEEHDTPKLMFNYARRSAEKTFGKQSIYC